MVVLLVVLAHFVIEEVLFVFEGFGAAHVLQQELRESGCYYVAFAGEEFDFRLAAVVHGEEAGGVVQGFRRTVSLETELKESPPDWRGRGRFSSRWGDWNRSASFSYFFDFF